MRALSGAIITAAALISLGLTAQGIGTRYAWVGRYEQPESEATNPSSVKTRPDLKGSHVKVHEMDNGLILSLTLAALSLLIGLGITFVGLMYHHHRRYHEHLRLHGQPAAAPSHHVHT
ncbi:MAG TPA: hypothetical protein VMF69_01365 [Gemmataceae bacterium]|nr:hypothetical protein [Gemmataceae bacterium]